MNGTLKQIVYGVIAAAVLALMGWTLNRVNDLSARVAKTEARVNTIEDILKLWSAERSWKK
jgi:hypothetical protein